MINDKQSLCFSLTSSPFPQDTRRPTRFIWCCGFMKHIFHSSYISEPCVAVYGYKTSLIQALQWIRRHLERDLSSLQDPIKQLQQEDSQDVIFVEAEVIFDDWHIQFILPPCLLAQELDPEPPEPLSVVPVLPKWPTRHEVLKEGCCQAWEWAARTYGPDGWCWH